MDIKTFDILHLLHVTQIRGKVSIAVFILSI